MKTKDDYRHLLDNFGVRRTSPYFWQHSDFLHDSLRLESTTAFGVLDYNRLENR